MRGAIVTGRPRLMTAANVSAILARIAQGQTLAMAAAATEPPLHPGTVTRWLARGATERTKLQALGLDADDIDLQDERITEGERDVFAFARAVAVTRSMGPSELHALLYEAATVGVEEITERHSQVTLEDGTVVDGPVQRTLKRQRRLDVAMWLIERMDPATYHLATRVELTGAGGSPIEIAGFSENQAEAFAVFVRVLLDELLALAPARSRAKLEKAIPVVLDAAMKAIEPPRTEEQTSG